ncbi:MAG: Xaa-Pro peptidase family protein [Oscillospiraceae bacterium]
MNKTRLEKVVAELKRIGLSQMIISDPSGIRYLTGIDIEPMERLFALYVSDEGEYKLFLNNMFTVPDTGLQEIWMSDTDDCIKIVSENIDGTADIGVDKIWPAGFLLRLMKIFPNVKYIVSSECVDRVRARKDAEEQEKMRRASQINDICMEAVPSFLHEGVTEKEVCEHIAALYLANGASGLAFPAITSFGANAADPHHSPDETVLKNDDCIVVDMGCVYEGYCSDMTRTFFCGSAPEKHAKIHDIVREANELAESMIKPGVRFCDLDNAAREYISNKGYGKYFTHRLGHSIGSDCHEAGDVSATNKNALEVGNTFSIEPGVYLPGEFGVRIEDLVIVTEDGCEILNHVDKHWSIV